MISGILLTVVLVLLALIGGSSARSAAIAAKLVPARFDRYQAYSTKTRTGCEYTPASAPEWDKKNKVNHILGPAGQTICGTSLNDMIHPTGPNVIWGRQGDDEIHAINGVSDKIDGAHGVDRVWADSCDKVEANVEHIIRRAGACKDVKGRLAAVGQATYSWQDPVVQCQEDTVDNVGFMLRFAEEPTMRAFDKTKRVDWQFVSWSAYLYKLVGTEWVATGDQTDWLWDWTYDEQVNAFPGNYWRRFKTNQRWFTWFTPPDPGSYRAAVKYRWHAANGTVAHEEFVYANWHFGSYESSQAHDSCTFPPS
jgi:hypothetical protein